MSNQYSTRLNKCIAKLTPATVPRPIFFVVSLLYPLLFSPIYGCSQPSQRADLPPDFPRCRCPWCSQPSPSPSGTKSAIAISRRRSLTPEINHTGGGEGCACGERLLVKDTLPSGANLMMAALQAVNRLSIMEVKWMSEAMLWSRTGSLNGSFHHKQDCLPSRLSSSFHGVFWVWDSTAQIIGYLLSSYLSHPTKIPSRHCFVPLIAGAKGLISSTGKASDLFLKFCEIQFSKFQMGNVVELKVDLDCDGCIKKILKAIKKMEDIETYDLDTQLNKVTITGNVTTEEVIKVLQKIRKPATNWGEDGAN
ncbi:hypothetical protein Vadar_030174 [Vaccinium darrowii]|uniref:Uncharacterized protein n=1 Tax=Vaccinium darrowii TaxID=229202 RepID=A0ACB7XL18_9ERIC|nr:hypothetical protein Vadar_030174 [Vaccinium darrowii]